MCKNHIKKITPCCGFLSLQKACIVTASIELMLSGIFILYNAIILSVEIPLAVNERRNAVENPDPYKFHAIHVWLTGLNLLYWIGCLFLGAILIAAAKQRDIRKLRSWFVLTCILIVLFIVDIFMEIFSMISPPTAILSPVLGTILQAYMMWIVALYMVQVAHHGMPTIKKGDVEVPDF